MERSSTSTTLGFQGSYRDKGPWRCNHRNYREFMGIPTRECRRNMLRNSQMAGRSRRRRTRGRGVIGEVSCGFTRGYIRDMLG